jgi:hypothetical protein
MSEKLRREYAINRVYFDNFSEQRITNLLKKDIKVRLALPDYSKKEGFYYDGIDEFWDF